MRTSLRVGTRVRHSPFHLWPSEDTQGRGDDGLPVGAVSPTPAASAPVSPAAERPEEQGQKAAGFHTRGLSFRRPLPLLTVRTTDSADQLLTRLPFTARASQ